MYKVGLSSGSIMLTEENFQKFRSSGIEAIELSMPLEAHEQIDHKALLDLSSRYDVALWSYHLPFGPFDCIDMASLSKDVRENTMAVYAELIRKATDIGIDKFVVHPSGEPIANADREKRMKYSMEMLDRMAELASGYGAVIAVEDLPRTCLGNTTEEIEKLISANDKLRVCFDTNHLLNDSNLRFVEKLHHKIITVHISDYDFVDEKHWLPGEGMVDWNELLSALQKHHYSGVWMYEIGLQSPRTLKRSRNLTFDDFVRNANEIFAGRKPCRIY